jgi:hypothetical protein
MGKPLMIQAADDSRIDALKARLHVPTKIGVVRAALDLLEQEAERRERVARWQRAARRAAATSRRVNADFRAHSRLARS